MPDISQVRYYFEHQFLPKLYYDPKIFLPISIKQNPDVINLNWKHILEQAGVKDTYPDGVWTVEMFEITDRFACVRILCPEPEKEPQCKWIFLLFHYSLRKRFYFTVEAGGLFEAGPFLCGWDRSHTHRNYGVCADDKEKALDQAIALYEQMEEDPAEPEAVSG